MKVLERVKQFINILREKNILNYLITLIVVLTASVVLFSNGVSRYNTDFVLYAAGTLLIFGLGSKMCFICLPEFIFFSYFCCLSVYRETSVLNTLEFVKDVLSSMFIFLTVTAVKKILEKRTAELQRLLLKDKLTGLYNVDALEGHIADYTGRQIVISYIDIDDFSYFNDSNGRAFGDKVLAKISSYIQEEFSDAVNYRYGDDEFLSVWVIDDPKNGVQRDFSGLQEKISSIPFDGTNQKMYLTFSAGCTWDNVEDAEGFNDLIRFATRKLYEAKNLGKNKIESERYRKDVNKDELKNNINTIYSSQEADKLTGLPDVICFYDRATRVIHFQQDSTVPVVMVYFNLVNFKSVNKNYGFDAGNEVIRYFGSVIQKYFVSDLTCRVNAENFVVLTFENELSDRILSVYRDVIDYYKDWKLVTKAGICKVSTDCHVSVIVDRAKLAADSIRDNYEKISEYYTPEDLGKRIQRQDYIINNLDVAMEKGYIKVFFQPVVRVFSRELCGFEALVRWDDPSYGFLSPADFISDLERFHLIHKLDEYVVKYVCERIRSRLNEGLSVVPVSVNLSRLDFDLCDIYQLVSHAVAVNRIPKNFIEIEVTEDGITLDPEHLKEEIKKFRNAGFEVWMDDFGSGYSSLNVLKDYNFDVLKIDMKFLSDFSARSKKIITSIVDMAKKIGIQTLAEGVETEEHFEFLRSIGCEMAQGYNFGKPMSEDEAFANIASKSIVIESLDSRLYNEDIGRVNLLSVNSSSINNGNAWAIIEFADEKIHFLQVNEPFIEVISTLGISSEEEADVIVNEKGRSIRDAFFNFVEKTTLSPEEERVDFYENKMFFSMSGRNVAHHKDKDAFLITLANLSAFDEFTKNKEMDSNLSFLYSIYERVDLIDLSTEDITTLYSNSNTDSAVDGDKISDFVFDFAKVVYPGDKDRFESLLNVTELKKKLEECHYTFVDDYFRFKNGENIYLWKTLLIVGNINNDKNQILLCLRPADSKKISRAFSNEISSSMSSEGAIPDAVLWQNLVRGIKSPVFWKDKERKYLGVNDSFIELFGLKDSELVIGHTDDEMGWFLDKGHIRSIDEKVLGGDRCFFETLDFITSGIMKKLVLNEMPVYYTGQLIGIVGQVTELTEHNNNYDLLNSLIFTDSVTEALNTRGYFDALLKFEEDYDSLGEDFILVTLSIDNYSLIYSANDSYFIDEVLKKVHGVIKYTVDNKSVISRLSKDNFCVLHKINDGSNPDTIVDGIKNAVGEISEINSKPCTVYLSAGYAKFSEAQSVDDILHMAELRMRGEKVIHSLSVMSENELVIDDKRIKYTRKELSQVMAIYKNLFDVVRVVNPSETQAYIPVGINGECSDKFCCYSIFNRNHRCNNCISARTITSRSTQSKFDVIEGDIYYAFTKYVEVDSVPYSLELIKKINETDFLNGMAKDNFIKYIESYNESIYKDKETGVYNRQCFDEMYVRLNLKAVALMNVEKLEEGVGLTQIADIIKTELKQSETLIHYDKNVFLAVFEDSSSNDLLDRLESLSKKFKGSEVTMGVMNQNENALKLVTTISNSLKQNGVKKGSVNFFKL